MAVKDLIGVGIGFSPGKAGYVITRGLLVDGAAAVAPIATCVNVSCEALIQAVASHETLTTVSVSGAARWQITVSHECCC